MAVRQNSAMYTQGKNIVMTNDDSKCEFLPISLLMLQANMDMSSSTRAKYKTSNFAYPSEPQYKYQRRWLPMLRLIEMEETEAHTDARLLFDAIKKGKYHLAKFILEASSNDLANATDIKGKSTLILCCHIKEQMCRTEMLQLFLENGTDVNIQDDHGRTVMSYACETKCNDIVDKLIKQNEIDPDLVDHKGNTPLIYSAIVGNDVATEMLTRNFRRLGLQIDHANKNGFTALLMAAKHGNISCARILVDQGHASLLLRDKIHGYSVQEWLKLGGYALEDVVSEKKLKQLKYKSKLVNAVSIKHLTIPRRRLSEMLQNEFDDDNSDSEYQSDVRINYREDRKSSYTDDAQERRSSYRNERRNSPREVRRQSLRDERRGSLRKLSKQPSKDKIRKKLSQEIAHFIDNGNAGESTLIIDPNIDADKSLVRRKSIMSVIDPTVLKNVIVLPPINKLKCDDPGSDTEGATTEVEDDIPDKRQDFICVSSDPKLVREDSDDDGSETDVVSVFSHAGGRDPIF